MEKLKHMVEMPRNSLERGADFFGKLAEEEIKAWELLVPNHRSRAIDPNSFSDIYSLEVIDRDTAYVHDMEERFKDSASGDNNSSARRGELLEAMMFEQIHLFRWFGKDADAMAVSRYDDIRNGIDMVIQFAKDLGIRYLGLTVDVTSSPERMLEKLSKIKGEIDDGQLTKVKYFDPNPKSATIKPDKTPRMKFRGELRDIPRVVVGIDNKSIRELSLLHVSVRSTLRGSKDVRNSATSREELLKKHRESLGLMARHRLQLLILSQIKLQLETFATYARSINKEVLATQYEGDLAIINEITNEKARALHLTQEDDLLNSEDMVFESLRQGLANFSKD